MYETYRLALWLDFTAQQILGYKVSNLQLFFADGEIITTFAADNQTRVIWKRITTKRESAFSKGQEDLARCVRSCQDSLLTPTLKSSFTSSVARILIDTNAFINLATGNSDEFSRDVKAILDDYENEFLISMESVRELIVAYRTKNLLSKYWKSAHDMVDSIERDFNIQTVRTDMEVMRTMSDLIINEAQEHNDPSDHIIIAHAMTLNLPLISSDTKFPFYRKQGLDLIAY